MFSHFLQTHLGLTDIDPVGEINSTELLPCRRALLQAITPSHRAAHIHCDLLDRLPPGLRDQCRAAQLDKTSSLVGRRLRNLDLGSHICNFFSELTPEPQEKRKENAIHQETGAETVNATQACEHPITTYHYSIQY